MSTEGTTFKVNAGDMINMNNAVDFKFEGVTEEKYRLSTNSKYTEIVLIIKDHVDHKKFQRFVQNGTVREAIEKELKQMIKLKAWTPYSSIERRFHR